MIWMSGVVNGVGANHDENFTGLESVFIDADSICEADLKAMGLAYNFSVSLPKGFVDGMLWRE